MKKGIVSILAVISMMILCCPLAFADDLEIQDFSIIEEQNLNENSTLNDELDGYVEIVILDANNIEKMEGDSNVDDDTDNNSILSSDLDSPVISDSDLNAAGDDSILIEDEGLVDDSFLIEDEVIVDEGLVDDEFLIEDEGLVDDDFGFSIIEEEPTIEEPITENEDSGISILDEEPLDDAYSIGSDTETIDIDVVKDSDGDVVYEVPEETYDGLDMDAPAVVSDAEEEVDAAYTMNVQEEAQGYDTYREPIIFKSYDGLTLYRTNDGSIAASDYVCMNSTGVKIALIGVEVVPVNGWEMVGREVDFTNLPINTREFRLTVNNQVILDYDGDGYISIYNAPSFESGEEICIPMELEIGPFNKAINEGLFSFVLVFEEVIDYEEVINQSMEEATSEEVALGEETVDKAEETSGETSGEATETIEGSTDIENTENVENIENVENEGSEDSASPEEVTEGVIEDIANNPSDEPVQAGEDTGIIEEPVEPPIEEESSIGEDVDIGVDSPPPEEPSPKEDVEISENVEVSEDVETSENIDVSDGTDSVAEVIE